MRKSRWPVAQTDADFDPYLVGSPPGTAEMFRAFVAMARSCGAVTFELQNNTVVLCGPRRIFASVSPQADGLTGHLVLDRQVRDPRIGKIEPLTKRLYFHRWKVSSPEALDKTFRDLLCQAYAIG